MYLARIFVVVALATMAVPAAAEDAHHPEQPAGTETEAGDQAAAPAPQASAPGMPTMGMMGQGCMPMMGMMGSAGMMPMMGMMGPGNVGAGAPGTFEPMDMPGTAMIDRIEGRIAFLRAELGIAEAQTGAWDALAEALRANAKRLAEARLAPAAATFADRLQREENWLSARLEGVRAMRTAFDGLYQALSEKQRKAADELFFTHMGLGRMGMTQGTQP